MIILWKDNKGYYHENPSINLKCEKVEVKKEEFIQLVKQGKVYRR